LSRALNFSIERKFSVGLDQGADFDVGDFCGAGHLQRSHDQFEQCLRLAAKALAGTFGLQSRKGFFNLGVAVRPGYTLNTRMPSALTSCRKLSAIHLRAC
jgi:hypothetical protein